MLDTDRRNASEKLLVLIEEATEEMLRRHPSLGTGASSTSDARKGDQIAQDSLRVFRERLSA